ncbi:uncharacterized protein LOC103707457 [Phoenix dactylifera]|uniref:Uncharacterized protein LOC103707457 n=1 Tax=Phoenix dactylifera TaxID=42345 RepID=A0A8B9AWM6_PHODC|nr:uncharacterized protein LOC103707457 [Phoenix dactylifera]XP_038990000.1 uncharacterized protein LOC103707457 [Phoenix dactylifera]XP_038990001.1 uncharacterized protein LOC103707457 [Phoenix dactylifera]XP_038990002.1 uncharacterized protein LOC103707457 [Phoenix dactylifera]XP_038990003.1 uncharacterized protein LOC103707457 [Phoenix dactylifera]XP_038990004.1 uncharacterized protein LOC103707457 [Phoenix dactylifera]XP_038990005.1 uncharacterized protein LOC103707457 [Phoenix dactylifer
MGRSIGKQNYPRSPPQIARPWTEFQEVGIVPPMNALEILRETVRILRADPSTFMTILALLICPVSAALLFNTLVDAAVVGAVSHRFVLLAVTSGLPPTHFLKQMCHHLAGTVVSSAFCFPLLISLLLLARASIVYSVACSYAGKKVVALEFFGTVRRIWRRLVSTYIWVCVCISGCLALFLALLVMVCSAFSCLGYPPEIVVYPALFTVLVFSMVYAHTIIVCNLASVISVLEDVLGPQALVRSIHLIKGQTQAGLLIFLGSAIGMAFVEGLFEHRVKTLSYGDGSSRLWEGPLLVLMYSFVVLTDYMMSAVFYFTCRSSSMGVLSGDGHSLEELEKISTELVDAK